MLTNLSANESEVPQARFFSITQLLGKLGSEQQAVPSDSSLDQVRQAGALNFTPLNCRDSK